MSRSKKLLPKAGAMNEAATARDLEDPPAPLGLAIAVLAGALMTLVATLSGNFN